MLKKSTLKIAAVILGITGSICIAFFQVSSMAEDKDLPGLIREPVRIKTIISDPQSLSLEALVVRPDRQGRFPLMMISHGTPGNIDDVVKMTPYSFEEIAIDFARRGWAVVIVMRQGYGQSDGQTIDGPEGPCKDVDYYGIANFTASGITEALDFLKQEPWVDPTRIVLLGHSAGGFGVTALAADNPKGVVGIIDFAGGRGGNGKDIVCQPQQLVEAARVLGQTAKVPSLWLYSENDHFFSPELARSMFDAYTQNQAPAQLLILPPSGKDGHQLLFNSRDLWQAPVIKFLDSLNLPTKIEITLPLRPSLPPPANINKQELAAFEDYLNSYAAIKVFAVGPTGYGIKRGARTLEDAKKDAIVNCEEYSDDCSIYAIGNQSPREFGSK